MYLGVKKSNLKFYLEILIHQEDIEGLIISGFLKVHIYLQL
jgi:hypothetical protein